MKEYDGNYYLGLDIGTDSVGYAVTDSQYNLLKYKGKEAWGSHLFDQGNLKAERRAHRSARRRLNRRKQRVLFVQELFAPEIYKVDPNYYIRIQGSYINPKDKECKYSLFNDKDYTDDDYYREYPTIHHLINELMTSERPHDVRLVYNACAWLVAHRGHFLNNIGMQNIELITDFSSVWKEFIEYLDIANNERFNCEDTVSIETVLKSKDDKQSKKKELARIWLKGNKPSKESYDEFPYSEEALIALLVGSKVSLKDLFNKVEYEELESISLSDAEEKFATLMTQIDEDYELIRLARNIFDWSLLVDLLSGSKTLSEQKVKIYEQHKDELMKLKELVRRYVPSKYSLIFKEKAEVKNNYAYYVNKSASQDDFYKLLKKELGEIVPTDKDLYGDTEENFYKQLMTNIDLKKFLPKQKEINNRVIPHQLYFYEFSALLDKASSYLPFLNDRDSDGLSVIDKLEKVFLYRIPYYVGPLNENSDKAWFKRKAEGKITPWNFDSIIDHDASEEAFISRLTNKCTYLPGEDVLPKDSLLYHKFEVLNEINNIKIDGVKIDVLLKQRIYNELFLKHRRVTRKRLENFLISTNYLREDNKEAVSGIDTEIKSNLSPYHDWKNILANKILSETDVEQIIIRSSFSEDKKRLEKWIENNYPTVSSDDRKYISRIKISGFGRLSRKFLSETLGCDQSTGEAFTIIDALWNTNNNLQELLSDKYSFKETIDDFRSDYYLDNKKNLDEKLDDLYISNSVRRSIYRTFDVVKDVTKIFGAPKKIFIEVTRGSDEEKKGKRTQSRYDQIIETYKNVVNEQVKQLQSELENLGERRDSKLRGDKLFLYFMQRGRCMYCNKMIHIEELGDSNKYDIDHIYPQSFVKDDSILHNRVLTCKSCNGEKTNIYPLDSSIQNQMAGFWKMLLDCKAITEEKYKRLIRKTGFTNEEKNGFINRQLTETSQTTKAVASLLKEKFMDSEIVYSKASLVSDFRHEFDLLKSRSYNDLHHAIDAYLNICTGNVYNMLFSRKYGFDIDNYNIKTKAIFGELVRDSDGYCHRHGKEQIVNNVVIWNDDILHKVISTAKRNTANLTIYQYLRHGELFNQQLLVKGKGQIERKKGLSIQDYGGYNSASIMCFLPVRCTIKKKSDTYLMSVEVRAGEKFFENEDNAREYAYKRMKQISGYDVTDISFPLGLMKIKMNSIIQIDGFSYCITGVTNKQIILNPIVQFSSDYYWNTYLHKIEKFIEKTKANSNHLYSEKYDKINLEDNKKLYELYCSKIISGIYSRRINMPKDILINGEDKFSSLDIVSQCKLLMAIHSLFGRNTRGADIKAIGGSTSSGITLMTYNLSNLVNKDSNVSLVSQSPSGLFESRVNLADIL